MTKASLKLNAICGDGSAKSINKRKPRRCQMKNIFSTQNRVVSTASKQSFDCVTPSRPVYFYYHSPYVIYTITCSLCSSQYIGETSQKLYKSASYKNNHKNI